MGLYTIFGINGVGKDTVAKELRNNNPNLKITSMSRILMYILGISKTYDVAEKITEEQYRLLENVPQNRMIDIENNEYKIIIQKMASSDNKVLFLSHLISALRHGNEIIYLTDRLTPNWFIDINEKLIQLVASPELISIRRKNDNSRNRRIDIEEIRKHQELCSQEWERISKINLQTRRKMNVVENVRLYDTVEKIQSIIFENQKTLSTNILRREEEDGR